MHVLYTFVLEQGVYNITHTSAASPTRLCFCAKTLLLLQTPRAAKGTEHVFNSHEYTLSGYSRLVTKLKKKKKPFKGFVFVGLFVSFAQTSGSRIEGGQLQTRPAHNKNPST